MSSIVPLSKEDEQAHAGLRPPASTSNAQTYADPAGRNGLEHLASVQPSFDPVHPPSPFNPIKFDAIAVAAEPVCRSASAVSLRHAVTHQRPLYLQKSSTENDYQMCVRGCVCTRCTTASQQSTIFSATVDEHTDTDTATDILSVNHSSSSNDSNDEISDNDNDTLPLDTLLETMSPASFTCNKPSVSIHSPLITSESTIQQQSHNNIHRSSHTSWSRLYQHQLHTNQSYDDDKQMFSPDSAVDVNSQRSSLKHNNSDLLSQISETDALFSKVPLPLTPSHAFQTSDYHHSTHHESSSELLRASNPIYLLTPSITDTQTSTLSSSLPSTTAWSSRTSSPLFNSLSSLSPHIRNHTPPHHSNSRTIRTQIVDDPEDTDFGIDAYDSSFMSNRSISPPSYREFSPDTADIEEERPLVYHHRYPHIHTPPQHAYSIAVSTPVTNIRTKVDDRHYDHSSTMTPMHHTHQQQQQRHHTPFSSLHSPSTVDKTSYTYLSPQQHTIHSSRLYQSRPVEQLQERWIHHTPHHHHHQQQHTDATDYHHYQQQEQLPQPERPLPRLSSSQWRHEIETAEDWIRDTHTNDTSRTSLMQYTSSNEGGISPSPSSSHHHRIRDSNHSQSNDSSIADETLNVYQHRQRYKPSRGHTTTCQCRTNIEHTSCASQSIMNHESGLSYHLQSPSSQPIPSSSSLQHRHRSRQSVQVRSDVTATESTTLSRQISTQQQQQQQHHRRQPSQSHVLTHHRQRSNSSPPDPVHVNSSEIDPSTSNQPYVRSHRCKDTDSKRLARARNNSVVSSTSATSTVSAGTSVTTTESLKSCSSCRSRQDARQEQVERWTKSEETALWDHERDKQQAMEVTGGGLCYSSDSLFKPPNDRSHTLSDERQLDTDCLPLEIRVLYHALHRTG